MSTVHQFPVQRNQRRWCTDPAPSVRHQLVEYLAQQAQAAPARRRKQGNNRVWVIFKAY